MTNEQRIDLIKAIGGLGFKILGMNPADGVSNRHAIFIEEPKEDPRQRTLDLEEKGATNEAKKPEKAEAAAESKSPKQEKKAKKKAAKAEEGEKEKAADPGDESPKIKLADVRAVLVELTDAGKQADVKRLVNSFGQKRITDVDPADYPALLEQAKELL